MQCVRAAVCLLLLTSARVPSAGASEYPVPQTMQLSDDGYLTQGNDTTTGLYDITELRTIYLEFEQDDWWQHLVANYASETDIPADLTFEGEKYSGVGVRFRGNTSYTMSGNSQKKSFNISLDYTDPDQTLAGYETLNLNNAFNDPTFMREVLYFNIFRHYAPCPRANFVKLYINDEYWGVYCNVEQVNADFIEKWFLSDDGDRWKAASTVNGGNGGHTRPDNGNDTPQQGDRPQPGENTGGFNPPPDSTGVFNPQQGDGSNPPPDSTGVFNPNPDDFEAAKVAEIWQGGGGFAGGEKALTWLGSDASAYENAYELKTAGSDDPWESLMNVCHLLNNTATDELPAVIDTVMDVDRWLWFLAMENIFTDEDSYYFKGTDYALYYEPETGRIHPLQHDGNESFKIGSVSLSPFEGQNNANRPVISRLLAVPEYRARYCAHYRTIMNEWLDWNVIGPMVSDYRTLIENAVTEDRKKFYSDEDFVNGMTVLENFVDQRRSYLSGIAELTGETPTITGMNIADGSSLMKTVTVMVDGAPGEVGIYYASGLVGPFTRAALSDDGAGADETAGDGVWSGSIVLYGTDSFARFYAEAADGESGAVAYYPSGAEHNVRYTETALEIFGGAVVINEIMADNDTVIQDPQGDCDDWIELLNVSDSVVDLSGMYLSDDQEDVLKWRFPEGSSIGAGEHLIIWADGDEGDEPGIHASFKLSADGEQVILTDTNAHENAILDLVTFGEQETDVSYGRYPDASGGFAAMEAPTPGAANRETTGIAKILPGRFRLSNNYPNPFNNTTTFQYEIPSETHVDIAVFNVLGQKVTTLVDKWSGAGTYIVMWNGCDNDGNELASGTYFCRMKSGNTVITRPLSFMK